MDEGFVSKIALVLLCLSSLLWIIVLFLIFWLGKIHHRVDSISKRRSVYCRLVSCEETPVTKENQPEVESPSSPLPLVFYNQQAADSDIVNSWKHMHRAFAYASVRSDVVAPHPSSEETASMSPVEGKASVDDAKTQEEPTPVPDVPVTSYLQIVDSNSTIVAISSSDRPVKDTKHDQRRIYISVSSADGDVDNNTERLEDATQTELETMPLDDKGDLGPDENENISSKNKTNTVQIRSKEKDISEAEKGSDAGKPECVVLIEGNREQKAAFYKGQPNLMKSQSDEQRNNKQESQEAEKNKAIANSGIVDGEMLPNKNERDFAAVFNFEESPILSEGPEKGITRNGDETGKVTPNEMRPKAKRRTKKKRSTGWTQADETKKTEERMSSLDNVAVDKNGYVITKHVEQLEKNRPNGGPDFTQTQERSGEHLKSNGVSKNEDQNDSEYEVVNQVDQLANIARTNVPRTPDYQVERVLEGNGKMKPSDGKQDQYMYDYATTQEVTERPSSIVLQLRSLLQKRTGDSAQYADSDNKSAAGFETAVQENKVQGKCAVEEYHANTRDVVDKGHQNTEQIYANVDGDNDDLYCEIPATAQPEAFYANQENAQNVGDEYSDNCPIYANINVRHGTATCNGNPALESQNEFAIYSNDIIDV
ncbi:uncharacterized protein LOC144657795 [Oculina patagonica]